MILGKKDGQPGGPEFWPTAGALALLVVVDGFPDIVGGRAKDVDAACGAARKDIHIREKFHGEADDKAFFIAAEQHGLYAFQLALDMIGGLEQDGFGRFPGIDVEIEEKAHEVGVILLGRGKDMPALRLEDDVAVIETGQIAFGLEELKNLFDSHENTLVLDDWEEGPQGPSTGGRT